MRRIFMDPYSAGRLRPRTGDTIPSQLDCVSRQGSTAAFQRDARLPHGTRMQIEVGDIDEAIRQSIENKAQIVRGKMEFDDFYLAYLVDPFRISFGLIQY
jgi:predicted enzyme related to lactoylglutathione lyase